MAFDFLQLRLVLFRARGLLPQRSWIGAWNRTDFSGWPGARGGRARGNCRVPPSPSPLRGVGMHIFDSTGGAILGRCV